MGEKGNGPLLPRAPPARGIAIGASRRERGNKTQFSICPKFVSQYNLVEYFARVGSYQEGHKVVNDALETIRTAY